MKTMKLVGSTGNEIELRAFCKTTMVEKEIDSDGYTIKCGTEPRTDANLELWVDGKKVDSCWDTNFWQLIDVPGRPEIKKIWGLKVGMSLEQAEKVEAFLESVIRDGKSAEVEAAETAEAEKKQAARVEEANEIIVKAERTVRNADGSLMTNDEARVWRRNYNNLCNEGGEGYVPEVITQEMYDWAKSVTR